MPKYDNMEDMKMKDEKKIGDMMTEEYGSNWYSFDEIPELKDAKVGDVITIQVRVVEKADDGAQIEIVKSSEKSVSPVEEKEEPTPEEAEKMSTADLEKVLPKASE